MAIIGTFTRNDNGLQGTVKTLTLKAKVRFVPLVKTSDASPDFRIIADTNVELGAAWKKVSKKGNAFTSVKLDDPSFAKPDLRLPGRGRGWRPQPDLVPLNRTEGAKQPPSPIRSASQFSQRSDRRRSCRFGVDVLDEFGEPLAVRVPLLLAPFDEGVNVGDCRPQVDLLHGLLDRLTLAPPHERLAAREA